MDVTNLNPGLLTVHRDLLWYLRSLASNPVGSAILNWQIRKEIRYQPTHPATVNFKGRLVDVHFYYRLSAPTSGFETPENWLLLLAVLSCDFDTLELLAKEGSVLARWFCCDRAISALHSGEVSLCDTDWARETESLEFEDHTMFDMLHGCLPYNSKEVTKFAARLLSQDEIDADANKMLDLARRETEYQDYLDEQRITNCD